MALGRFKPDVQASSLPIKERGDIWRADPLLANIAARMTQTVEKFDLSTLWVTNAAGDTVAEGHAHGVSPFAGTNYADRAYFKAAQMGMEGHQFAIGRITNIYGLFFSSPVQINQQFVGIVGVGLPVSRMSPVIAQINAIVTDDLGVIVLAKAPDLLMRAMPDAKVHTLTADELDKRYKRKQFDTVDLQRGLERPSVRASEATRDGALRVVVMRDLGEAFTDIQDDQRRWFGAVSLLVLLTSTLIAGAAYFVISTQRQQDALQEVNQQLARQANTDALTGCANRRYFMQVLEQEHHRAKRYGSDFCVLSMDIDFFKRVNDTYGHAAGDDVLKHFVATIQSKLRVTDLLGRLGGEEFSVLLIETSADHGALMAERLRASIEASPTLSGTANIGVTVSIGGAQWSAETNAVMDELLAHADETMYGAKHGGRNRVVWAEPC